MGTLDFFGVKEAGT